MRIRQRILLVVAGVVPLLVLFSTPPDPTLLPLSLLVLAFWQRDRVTRAVARVRARPALKLLGLGLLAGLLVEGCAWLSNFLARSPTPALFHPQLIPDLLLGSGFYLGVTLALLIVLCRWRFSLGAVIGWLGVWGIVVEQDGAVLRAGLESLPANPILAVLLFAYVFAVYGAFGGLAYLPIQPEAAAWTPRDHWLKVPALLVLVTLLVRVMFYVLALGWLALGLIPEPQPIWVAPLF